MMTTPYKPRLLSQCDVEVLQELIFSQRSFALSKADSSQRIRFLQASAQVVGAASFTLSLDIDHQKVDLVLEPALESSLAHRLLEFGDVEALPEEFRTALKAFCSREIINSLEHLLQLSISLWEQKESRENPIEGKILNFEVIKGDSLVEAQGKITLPLPLLKRLISFAAPLPKLEHANLVNCSLDGELIVGSAKLSLTQWNHLTSGSLVFLEEPSAIGTGAGYFFLKKSGKIPVSFNSKQLQTLLLPLAKISPSGFDASLPMKKENEEELASFEKQITIELDFSAGALSLSLDEIFNLSSTKEIASPLNIFRPLKILAQGGLVGAGELVELHGRYALFITQLTTNFYDS